MSQDLIQKLGQAKYVGNGIGSNPGGSDFKAQFYRAAEV